MNVVVLSPHRDDAAFSCGLLLHSLLTTGSSVTIVNVCTISDYAPYLNENSQERVSQVTAARFAEDEAFIAALISDSRAEPSRIQKVDLAWKDAPLRLKVPEKQVLQTSQVRQSEVQVLSKIFLKLMLGDVILVPSAIGGHVDHILVREAALQAYGSASLLFYEDLPYACRTSDPHRSGTMPNDSSSCEWWSPALTPAPGTKRKYALLYPSQVASDVAEEMEVYAKTLEGRERFHGTPDVIQRVQASLGRHGALA